MLSGSGQYADIQRNVCISHLGNSFRWQLIYDNLRHTRSFKFRSAANKNLDDNCCDKYFGRMTSRNYSILEESLGYLISITGQRYKNEAWRRLRSFGITLEQWLVLNCLAVDEGICQRELAQRIDKEQPNTTRILDNMERKELIRREPDPLDRRALRVFLTEKGKSFLEELLPVAQQLRDESIRGFSDSEIQMARELLQKFLANLG